jgi:eukaryotic-like serine/threonine-protein kinase
MATQQGVLLGTAAYMSPEQAKAKPVDRRADIWAFGCVLYEMLTGKQTFTGETVTDTLAAVIRAEPDRSQLPADTPMRVRVLLQRCLQKDPKQRLQAIGDARISLDEVLSGAPEAASGVAAPPLPAWRRAIPWTAGLLAVAIAILATWILKPTPVVVPEVPMRLQIAIPHGIGLVTNTAYALSPDGRELAFAGTGTDGVQRLWVRSLDSLQAKPLPGTESPNLVAPFFWSPDSRFIAFDAGGKLKKVSIAEGSVETICNLDRGMAAVGGSWNRDGVIIFGQSEGGLMQVPASGGTASPLTVVDRSRGEFHHVMPSFLPDGRHFLYAREGSPEVEGVYVGSLDAKPEQQSPKRFLASQDGIATYVPSSSPGLGNLLFDTEGTLRAQPFDAQRLELYGEPVALADNLASFVGGASFRASDTGVVVYRTGGQGAFQLNWYDEQGKSLGTVGEPAELILSERLSPDGTRAAESRIDARGVPFIWLLDFSRGTDERFTFGSPGSVYPVWSPDGKRIVFASGGLDRDLYEKPANGATGEELLLKSDQGKTPTSWSRDGRFLLYSAGGAKGKNELWVLPMEGDTKPFPFLRTDFNNTDGQFSPDGRWVAYVSDESGSNEIYVRPFSPEAGGTVSSAGGKWLISNDGGAAPRWRADGKALYYIAPDGKLMAVEITTTPAFQARVPKALFQAPQLPPVGTGTFSPWDLAADGKRFLFVSPATAAEGPFTVLLNWQAALKK